MPQICDVANKFKTLKALVVFFQHFTGNIFAKDTLALVCVTIQCIVLIPSDSYFVYIASLWSDNIGIF